MDLAIVDTFVRPDPAPYAANRADDRPASSSFSDLLQERIATPAAGENRAETASSSSKPVQAATDKPERNAAAEANPATQDKSTAPVSSARDDGAPVKGEDAASADPADADTTAAEGNTDDATAEAPVTLAPVLLPQIILPSVATNAQLAVAAVQPAPLLPAETEPATGSHEPDAADALTAPLSKAPAALPTPVAPAPAVPMPTAAAPATDPLAASPTPEDSAVTAPPVADVDQTAAVPQLAKSADTAAIAALAATPVVAPTAQPEKSTSARQVDRIASDSALQAADTATSDVVVTVDTENMPMASRHDAARLTPTGVAAAAVSTDARTALDSATSYATQIAAQDVDALASESAADGGTGRTAPVNVKAEAAPVMAEAADANAVSSTTQPGNHTAPSTATDLVGLRSTQTVSDSSATASHASRSMAAQPVAEQIAVRMTKAVADSVDRIRIQLSPVELGHIDVRMEIGPDGRFNAVFAADRPQTVELLQRDARELARSLQDAGLRADMGSLSFNLRGDGQPGENAALRDALREARDGQITDMPVETPALPPAAYTGTTGGNGRLDIRV